MTSAFNWLNPTNGQEWLPLLMMVLIAPLLEEFVMRAGVHQALIQAGARPWVRLGVVAFLFGILHLHRSLWLALGVVPAALLIGWVYERFQSWRRCALTHALLNAAWIALAMTALPAHADALRGKTLYNSSPAGGGATCAGCHGTNPTQNISKILNGANNPTLITSAINGNTGGMGILKNKWTATDITDIALYLGNPNVSGAAVAAISPGSLAYSSTIVATSAAAQTVTLSNTGNAALSISGISLGGSNPGDFSAGGSGACVAGGSLAASSSCTISISFTPLSVGARSANLVVSHALGQSTVSLSGTGAAVPQATISLNQNLLGFGSVTQGTSSGVQSIVISNTGNAALVLSGISVSGAGTVFSTSGTCVVGASLPASSACTVDVRFSPNAIASFNGSLQLTSNASNGTVSVTLQGTGAAVPAPLLSVSPGSLGFGNQTVGATSGAQTITLQNTGNASATLGAPSLSGSAMFSMVNASACGTTLAAGASCSLQVQFRPTAATAQTANLNITSNSAGSPHQVSLSGTGVNQPTPSPTLSQALMVSFADTTVGQQSTVTSATAGNSGSAAYTITQVSLSGANAGDFVLSGDCVAGKVMASGSSCTLSVKFAPSAVGLRQARVNLVTNSGTTMGFDVQGSGKAVATVSGQLSVASLDFGSVVAGNSSATQRTTLKNTGNQTLSISAVNAALPFVTVTDTTTCPAAPFTLAPGLQCDIALRFTPSAAGTSGGTVTVSTVAPGPTLQASLTGVTTVVTAPAGNTSSGTTGGTGTTGTPASGTTTGTTTTDTAGAASKDAATALTPQNAGAGGCTMSPNGNDASMVLLLIAALITGLWRRSFSPASKLSKTKESV